MIHMRKSERNCLRRLLAVEHTVMHNRTLTGSYASLRRPTFRYTYVLSKSAVGLGLMPGLCGVGFVVFSRLPTTSSSFSPSLRFVHRRTRVSVRRLRFSWVRVCGEVSKCIVQKLCMQYETMNEGNAADTVFDTHSPIGLLFLCLFIFCGRVFVPMKLIARTAPPFLKTMFADWVTRSLMCFCINIRRNAGSMAIHNLRILDNAL